MIPSKPSPGAELIPEIHVSRNAARPKWARSQQPTRRPSAPEAHGLRLACERAQGSAEGEPTPWAREARRGTAEETKRWHTDSR